MDELAAAARRSREAFDGQCLDGKEDASMEQRMAVNQKQGGAEKRPMVDGTEDAAGIEEEDANRRGVAAAAAPPLRSRGLFAFADSALFPLSLSLSQMKVPRKEGARRAIPARTLPFPRAELLSRALPLALSRA